MRSMTRLAVALLAIVLFFGVAEPHVLSASALPDFHPGLWKITSYASHSHYFDNRGIRASNTETKCLTPSDVAKPEGISVYHVFLGVTAPNVGYGGGYGPLDPRETCKKTLRETAGAWSLKTECVGEYRQVISETIHFENPDHFKAEASVEGDDDKSMVPMYDGITGEGTRVGDCPK